MSKQNSLELAKQGNPCAIARLINHNLKSKGVIAKVSRENDCLQIILESLNEVPPQKNLIKFIHQGILKIGITEIKKIHFLGRQAGDKAATWSQEIELKKISSESNPSILDKSKRHNSREEKQIVQLKKEAKEGNIKSLSKMIGKAISSEDIKSKLETESFLELKIHTLARIEPQSCIQAVIDVLNDVQPDKIRVVSVSEIASDTNRLVWNRFLALKKGKFVDDSTSINIRLGIVVVLMIGLLGYCVLPKQSTTTPTTATSTAPRVQQERHQSKQSEWYEGGTLHNSSALEWQQASYENKLATCADFVSVMWEKKHFKPLIQNQIKSMDDIRVLAEALVIEIDAATVENEQMGTNTISEIAALLMIIMGWVE